MVSRLALSQLSRQGQAQRVMGGVSNAASWPLDGRHHPQGTRTRAFTQTRRATASVGWAVVLATGRGELRMFQRSLLRSQAALQQGARRAVQRPEMSSIRSLAAVSWPWQGLASLLRLGRHSRGSTAEGSEGIPSTASMLGAPVTRTLPVLEPLPDESGPMLEIETGVAAVPSPHKANGLGEDAYFISKDGKTFGVADGVGGWAASGIDSGEYSRLLMQMSQLFSESKKLDPHPKQVLWAAFKQVDVRGSSTACVLKLKNDVLHACNVGDSGFMIVRKNEVIFQSPHQQHSFNFPYQLGQAEEDAANETPARAQVFAVQLQPEDIIVTGTDGLFDNVFPEESAALVRHARSRGDPAAAAAQTLVEYTFKKAGDQRHMSPFAYAAQAHGHRYVGGKVDDITILVSYVSAAADQQLGSGSDSDLSDGPEAPPPLSKL